MADTLTDIANFNLVARLGVGAFGTVWKAHDTKLDRTVAVKIPRRGHLAPQDEKQFLHEARVAARLSHPNIVAIRSVEEGSP